MQTGIFYVLNNRFPTIKAHGLQVAKTCEAFKKNGAKVRLIVPMRRQSKEVQGISSFDFYGIRDKFRIIRLPSFDFTSWGLNQKFLFTFQQSFFAFLVLVYLSFKKGIIYSRDQFSLYFLSLFRSKIFWEIHRFPDNIKSNLYRRLLNKVAGIVVISQGLRDKFIEHGFPENKILVAPDGIDLEEFTISQSTQDARLEFGLPLDKKIVMYAGHLFEWKGADVLVRAAQDLSNDALVVIVGGVEDDIKRLKSLDVAHKVRFEGFKWHKMIPVYLRAADVLVLPNKKDGDISEYYTSPLKLFEYMASGKPIIASDLPSLREILHEDNAFFIQSNDSADLVQKINYVLDHQEEAHQKSQMAFHDAENYSWEKRGQKILNFIKNAKI